jgi:LPXTG-motif cell wall-anchored protein
VSAPRLIAVLCVLLLAALPAAAWADGGAGDNQYQDPLTAPNVPHKKHKPATAPAATTAPAASTSPTATPATEPASNTAQPATGTGELPRTGAPAGLIALTGAGLFAAGLVLRRRGAQT